MAEPPSSETSPKQKESDSQPENNNCTSPSSPPPTSPPPPAKSDPSPSDHTPVTSDAPQSSSPSSKEAALKSSAPQTLTISIPVASNSVFSATDGGTDRRTFSQLLAGAMAASPAASSNSPRTSSILAVPVVAVPCFIAPGGGLLDSPRFTGQFAMTHQAVLATVTAQAQMQLQGGYPSPSHNALPLPMSTLPPSPLQQRPLLKSEESIVSPDAEQLPASDQKLQSTHVVVKTNVSDGYNWRKYGQKQVKSSESSRSYYRCTHANCSAKKKVEHCQDGRVLEIVYHGQHNHEPPQKAKCSKERGSQSSGPLRDDEKLDVPGAELNDSDGCPSKVEQISGNDTPEQLHCSSDCEGDLGTKTEEDLSEEPDPKRRLCESPVAYSTPLKTVKEPKVVVQTASDSGPASDGYRWRKYGQKIVKGNPNPRSYYKCTHMGCPVRKHVERASEDAKAIIITYEGKHNHDLPPSKNGSDPLATTPRASAAAAATATAMNSDEQMPVSSSSTKAPSTEHEAGKDTENAGERASELGGEKALESAKTLLSMGCGSTTGEEKGTANGSDVIQRPLFDGNQAAVPVQNS